MLLIPPTAARYLPSEAHTLVSPLTRKDGRDKFLQRGNSPPGRDKFFHHGKGSFTRFRLVHGFSYLTFAGMLNIFAYTHMPTATADSLKASSQLLKALADPVRLRILHLLSEADEICVCHIHEALKLPQPTVSRHLAYLRKRGLVSTRKEGLWVHYRLARASSSLHRGLMVCLHTCLTDVEELRRDRERLQGIVRCAG
jgi:ArsR family transcriptional regulator